MRHLAGRAAFIAAVLLGSAARPAAAQDPVRLPGVNVTARIEKPGPRIITGIVVDTAGNPIGNAEVTMPDARRRVMTRDDGTFRLDDIGGRSVTMRARKLGYAPQVREFAIDTAGAQVAFMLLPITTTLPTMISSANRRGVSGWVGDIDLRSVEGATVRVLGQGLTTTTNSDGTFFLPAQPGRYVVSIQKESFTPKLVGVTVPKDSGRHFSAWLMPMRGPAPREKFWVIENLRERQAWVKPENRVLYSREDLERHRIEWIYDAVLMAGTRFMAREAYSPDCMVVINGGPEFMKLSDLTIDDVESVEVYAGYGAGINATAQATKSRSKFSKVKGPTFLAVGSNNLKEVLHENSTRYCAGVYVWTR